MSLDIQFILAGLLVGFLVGVTGVGGGSLMTPILISVLRIEPNIAIGTDLLYASISKLCGTLVHSKKLTIIWPLVIWLSVGSIPASLGTTWFIDHYLSHITGYKTILTLIIGFMLLLTGISVVFRHQIEKFFNRFRSTSLTETATPDVATIVKNKKWFVVVMGVVLGIFVTMSSVGAGAFGVMALILLFPKLPMIRIIGSDVAHAVLLTFVAGLSHLGAGNVDFHMLQWLLVGAIPAIIVGTLLSTKLPEHAIRRVLGITLILLGINFVLHPSKSKPKPVVAPVVSVVQPTAAAKV